VVGLKSAILDAQGMTRMKRDQVYSFDETGLWFQQREGQRASLSKVTHITSHKEKLLYLSRELFRS
jgi:hypothetical protein